MVVLKCDDKSRFNQYMILNQDYGIALSKLYVAVHTDKWSPGVSLTTLLSPLYESNRDKYETVTNVLFKLRELNPYNIIRDYGL